MINNSFIAGIWNNRLWKRTGLYALDTKDFPVVVGPSGHRFYVTDDLFTVAQVWHDYDFYDIRSTDVVLDIGANIGGFAIPAAELAKEVVAVEPIRQNELMFNVGLNFLKIRIIPFSLGNSPGVIWRRNFAAPPNASLTTFKEMAGGCDVLKCDCEGSERYINPEELDGIRRIEMEFHKPYATELFDYIKKNWETTVDKHRDTMIVHAREK